MLELVYEPDAEEVHWSRESPASRPTDKLVASRYLLHFSFERRSEGAHDVARRGEAEPSGRASERASERRRGRARQSYFSPC